MPRITMTVHGIAFCSEQFTPIVGFDDTGTAVSCGFQVDSGIPRGWGRGFSLTGWYHVAIPNISHFDGAPMFLDEILILMSNTRMRFDRLDIWVGGRFLWTGPPAVMSSSNPLFRPRDPSGQRMQVNSGLGVSMFFTNLGGGTMTFHSAAATTQTTP